MKGQKQSRIDSLERKLQIIGGALDNIINELGNLKDLSIGTIELVKHLDGYAEAVEKLKESVKPEEENVE